MHKYRWNNHPEVANVKKYIYIKILRFFRPTYILLLLAAAAAEAVVAVVVVVSVVVSTSDVTRVYHFQVKWVTGRTGLRRVKTAFLIKSTRKEWPTVKGLLSLSDNVTLCHRLRTCLLSNKVILAID